MKAKPLLLSMSEEELTIELMLLAEKQSQLASRLAEIQSKIKSEEPLEKKRKQR